MAAVICAGRLARPGMARAAESVRNEVVVGYAPGPESLDGAVRAFCDDQRVELELRKLLQLAGL